MRKMCFEVERKDVEGMEPYFTFLFSVSHGVKQYVEREGGLWAQKRSQKNVLRNQGGME